MPAVPSLLAKNITVAEVVTALQGVIFVADASAISKLESIKTILGSSLPLPTGAATSAEQATLLAAVKATLIVQDATAETRLASIITLLEGTRSTSVTNFPATQPISAAALPLPTSAAKDGTDGEGIPQPTGGIGIRGWLSGIYQAVTGTLKTTRPIDVVEEGTLTSTAGVGSEIKVAVLAGMSVCSMLIKGIYATASAETEASFDGGTTSIKLFGNNVATGAGSNTPLTAATNITTGWQCAIPPGATHIRIKCTAITSGTINVKITQGSASYNSAIATVSSINTSANVIGGTFSPGQWTDLSSTNLKSLESYVSSSFDLSTVATAVAFSQTSTGVGEYRVSATASSVGMLYLETSRDNVIFKKIKSIKLAQAEGCEFYGEIIHRPSERYIRVSYTTVAEQTFFKLSQFRIANS